MYSYHSLLRFGQRNELIDDLHAGARPIDEVEIDVIDALVAEAGSFVGLRIEAHDVGDSELLEDGYVVSGSEGAILG